MNNIIAEKKYPDVDRTTVRIISKIISPIEHNDIFPWDGLSFSPFSVARAEYLVLGNL